MAPPVSDDQDIAGQVARGEIAPVYCLSGERYLVDAAYAAIRAAVLGQAGAAAGFNHDTFELKEAGIETCLSTARTLPMMAKRRLVVGKGIDQLKADALEPLADYVADPNPTTCLVLLAEKVDVRFKAFIALRKAGFLHVFQPLRDNALAGWLRAEARARKIDLAADAASALADLAGPELGRLSHALDQLALYAGARAITLDDVETLIAETRQRNVFELTKTIGAGDVPRALGLLANMLRNREPALRIQYMLARQMRQIWRAKELLAAGAPRNEIAGAVGISPYFLDDVLVPAKRMSRATLARAFERLYQSDLALKSSRVDEELLISRLVQQLAEDAGARPTSSAR
ncbi:MAG TPA: DNA polymerase III subunit delta [Polyangia bacterium]|nr:DNA polymerase III subunit delta [Polyangia bacterium]